MIKSKHKPVLHAFDRFRLLDSVQLVSLHVCGTKTIATTSFSSDFEHAAEFSTPEVFVEHVKVPLKLSRTLVARRDRLGIPDTSTLF
jgi:hypothetical protein